MKKGFTLVEILATLVLLGLISLIVFPKALEMIQTNQAKIDKTVLEVLYRGADQYLAKEENAYPKLEGNTFCVSPTTLAESKFVPIDTSELEPGYVVRAVVNDEEKLNFTYVETTDCIEKGVIAANLKEVSCEILTSGYAYNKTVKIQYPVGETYSYSYSFDNGKTWKNFTDTKKDGVNEIDFGTNGYIIARVKDTTVAGYKSCAASIVQVDKTEVGSLIAYAGREVPRGYMLADGKEISRKANAELFKKIGATYGSGNGSTTFNLPNMLGRTVVGSDTGISYASSIGTIGGEVKTTLTAAQLPSHTHTFTGNAHTHSFAGTTATTSSSGAHTHTVSGTTASAGAHTQTGSGNSTTTGSHSHGVDIKQSGAEAGGYGLAGTASGFGGRVLVSTDASKTTASSANNNHNHAFSGTLGSAGAHTQSISITAASSGAHAHSLTAGGTIQAQVAGGTNAAVGGGKAHENVQPYLTIQYLIKYQ